MVDDNIKALDDSLRKTRPILKKSSSFFDMIEIPINNTLVKLNHIDD